MGRYAIIYGVLSFGVSTSRISRYFGLGRSLVTAFFCFITPRRQLFHYIICRNVTHLNAIHNSHFLLKLLKKGLTMMENPCYFGNVPIKLCLPLG